MNGIFHNASHRHEHVRARIARAFSRGAQSYDHHAELQRDVADQLLTQVPPLAATATVIDLGCGTGYCTQRLLQLLPGASVVSLDLAEPMLKKTRDRCGADVPLLCADALELPVLSASIDFICSSLAVQWCDDMAGLLAELQRVLRPGGYALISTLGPQTLSELRQAWKHVDSRQHANRFSSKDEVLSAVAGSGLQGDLQIELRTRYYGSLMALAHELKGLGANTVSTPQTVPTSATAFRKASAMFEKERNACGIPVSWEVFYLLLHKPD